VDHSFSSKLGCLARIANGLDRSWEAHRVEGMEMLQHSVDILKERQGRRQPTLSDRAAHAVTRDRSKSRSDGIHGYHQTAESFNLPVAAQQCTYLVVGNKVVGGYMFYA